MVVNGDTTGTTRVGINVKNLTKAGELTNNGIELIKVTGKSESNNFKLPSPIQLSAFEYDLIHKPQQGFYLVSTYRPAVTTYVMGQLSNQNAIGGLVGDQLHKRVGEQEVLRWNGEPEHDQQVWGRLRHNSLDLSGKKQLDLEQKTSTIQFGWDLDINRDDQNARQHTGIYAAYSNTSADVFDRKRLTLNKNTFTGKIKGNILGLGGYHTRYDEQGKYVDMIGGIHFVNNKYSDIYGGDSRQNGWGVSASIEAGMPISVQQNWFVEPQAQLTWQMTEYGKFNDDISHIDGYRSQSLRPRLGVRIGYNDQPENQEAPAKNIYLMASIIRELLTPESITIDGKDLKEEMSKDTWLEVGLGGQWPINRNTYIYGSAQYMHTLSTSSRSGFTGQAGLRYSW